MSTAYRIRTFNEYKDAYKNSVDDPEKFWGDIGENFFWKQKWDKVLDWNFSGPDIRWYINARLNITENCIDRHLDELGNKPAIIWEPNDPEEHHRVLTYKNLYDKVCQFCHVLKNNGVKKGDRVC